MSISQELINLEHKFLSLKQPPLIINDVADISEDEVDTLRKKIHVTYDSDLMKSIASCECGAVVGEHKIGQKCDICSQECTPSIEQNFDPIIWMRSPKGVRKLINPQVWIMLRKRFTKNGHNILMWLCDRDYKSQTKHIKELDVLTSMGVQRGYNWFVDNFDKMMEVLFMLPGLRKKPSDNDYDENKDLMELLVKQRDCIFSDYLPLPNRALLVIEKTNVGTYADPIVVGVIDAIQTIASIDSELSTHSLATKENRTAKVLDGVATFYEDSYKTTMGEKTGLFRKHVFGSRAHFSFRTVASSITEPHDHRELHVSWGAAVGTFKYHIINKLEKRGFSANTSLAFLNKYATKYNPILDEIFEELIRESKYGGIPVTHGRNPSLKRGSMQLLLITKVKKDPADPTVSFSILICAPYNADFDGDALNSMVVLDNFMADKLMDLQPYKSAFSLDGVKELSGDITMSKPVVATIANFFQASSDTEMSLDQAQFLEDLEAI